MSQKEHSLVRPYEHVNETKLANESNLLEK